MSNNKGAIKKVDEEQLEQVYKNARKVLETINKYKNEKKEKVNKDDERC